MFDEITVKLIKVRESTYDISTYIFLIKYLQKAITLLLMFLTHKITYKDIVFNSLSLQLIEVVISIINSLTQFNFSNKNTIIKRLNVLITSNICVVLWLKYNNLRVI